MGQAGTDRRLFRPAAVAARRNRWLGDVIVATPPGAIVAAACGVLACLFSALAAVLIRIPEKLPVSGVMLPAQPIVRIVAPRAGIVDRLAVEDGERVAAGQRLFDLRAPGGQDRASTLPARQRSVEREIELLAAEAAADSVATAAALEDLARRVRDLEARVAVAGRRHRLLDRRGAIAVRRHDRGKAALARGALPAQQVDALEDTVLAADVEVATAEEARRVLQAEIAVLKADDTRLRQAAAERVLQRLGRRERLERDRLALAEAAAIRVTAPAGGTVGGVRVADSTSVAAGDLVLQLFEPGSELEAFLYISADHAGRVRPGQRVELRLHGYPYRLYGTLPACIRHVAAVPVPAGGVAYAPGLQGSVIELRAVIDRAAARTDWSMLRIGATFDAELVYARWPLYRWLLRGTVPRA